MRGLLHLLCTGAIATLIVFMTTEDDTKYRISWPLLCLTYAGATGVVYIVGRDQGVSWW